MNAWLLYRTKVHADLKEQEPDNRKQQGELSKVSRRRRRELAELNCSLADNRRDVAQRGSGRKPACQDAYPSTKGSC